APEDVETKATRYGRSGGALAGRRPLVDRGRLARTRSRRGLGAFLLLAGQSPDGVGRRRFGEQCDAADFAPGDDAVEARLAEREHHFHVLRLHQAAHVVGDVGPLHFFFVRTLVALDDAAAVREQVRDDVRGVEARVLRLNVKNLPLVLHVVVEAHLRTPKGRPAHLRFYLL